MPSTATIAQLRSLIYSKAAITADVLDTAASTTVIDSWIRQSIEALWDMLLDQAPQAIPVSALTVALTASTESYALPADFYRLVRADIQLETGRWVRMAKEDVRAGPDNDTWSRSRARYAIQGARIYIRPTPASAATVRVTYYPVAPVYGDPAAGGTADIDFVNGWQRFVVADVIVAIKNAQDEYAGPWVSERSMTAKAIVQAAKNQAQDGPTVVRDVYEEQDRGRRPYDYLL